MKRSLLVISLLFSAALSARTFEEAKRQLEIAQANYDAALARVEKHKQAFAKGQQKILAISDKDDNGEEMERQKAEVRKEVDMANGAVDECKKELERLQSVISKVGKEHQISSEGERFKVVKVEQPKVVPITRKVKAGPRRPYATKGSTYPRAKR